MTAPTLFCTTHSPDSKETVLFGSALRGSVRCHRLLPDFFTCTIKVLVDFKHSACDGFAFIKLLNPDKSKFESLSFCKPGRACQSVRIVPCHRKRRSRSLRFVPSGARLLESRQHQASCGSLRLSPSPRRGFRRTFKNLDCTTGLLSFEMSRFSTYWARGFQVQCRADPPVLGLSVRRMFSRRSTSRVTKFTLFLNVLFIISFTVVRLQFLH